MSDAADDNLSPEEAMKLLSEARNKARSLFDHLLLEQAQVNQNPPKISPKALAEGRHAMSRAVDAARRTLEAIEAAIATAPDALAHDEDTGHSLN